MSLLQKLRESRLHVSPEIVPQTLTQRVNIAAIRGVEADVLEDETISCRASKANQELMRTDLEHSPFKTVVKVCQSPLDDCLSLMSPKAPLIDTLRQCDKFSPVRDARQIKRMLLEQFRMLHVETNLKEDCDEVVLMRTKTLDPFETSTYNAISMRLL